MDSEAFSRNLKAARKAKNKTQKQVATEVGVSPETYSRYESNKTMPSLRTFSLLCLTLETAPSEMFNEGEFNPFYPEEEQEKFQDWHEKDPHLLLQVLQVVYKHQQKNRQ